MTHEKGSSILAQNDLAASQPHHGELASVDQTAEVRGADPQRLGQFGDRIGEWFG